MVHTSRRFSFTLVVAVVLTIATLGCSSSSSSSPPDVDAPAIAATVNITDGRFDPRVLDVEIGGSVMWINDDVTSHDLKFMAPNKISSGAIKPGGAWIHTFSSAGTYDYYCDIHNTMKGSVVVRPAP